MHMFENMLEWQQCFIAVFIGRIFGSAFKYSCFWIYNLYFKNRSL